MSNCGWNVSHKVLLNMQSGISSCMCGSLSWGASSWSHGWQRSRSYSPLFPQNVYPRCSSTERGPPLYCHSAHTNRNLQFLALPWSSESVAVSKTLFQQQLFGVEKQISLVKVSPWVFIHCLAGFLPDVLGRCSAAASSSSTAARRRPHASHSLQRWSPEGSSVGAESPAQWRCRPQNRWQSPLALLSGPSPGAERKKKKKKLSLPFWMF